MRARWLSNPSLPDGHEAPASWAACCLPSRGPLCHPLPSCPQHLRTKFAKLQRQVELGGQRVATCQQLVESLLELGHRAAPDAHQRQQDLQ